MWDQHFWHLPVLVNEGLLQLASQINSGTGIVKFSKCYFAFYQSCSFQGSDDPLYPRGYINHTDSSTGHGATQNYFSLTILININYNSLNKLFL